MFAINGIKLDDDLTETIDEDGLYLLEIPGDRPPVYNADGTLNVTASTGTFIVSVILIKIESNRKLNNVFFC